jgi:PIN domain nuclease of toxin-antitoxin system
VKLLLDTHAFIWANSEVERLGRWRDDVEDPENDRILSAVCAWEIAIKWSLERLELPEPPAIYVPSRSRALAVEPLAIDAAHALGVADLPRHHRDPFDRLLIAQARDLDLPILTADRVFTRYDVEVLLIE